MTKDQNLVALTAIDLLADATLKTWREINYLSGYPSGGWCRHCTASFRVRNGGYTTAKHSADCPVLLAETVKEVTDPI